MIDNTSLLAQLLRQGKIALLDAPFLHQTPPPLPPDLSWDRLEGMLLGLAIGDSLGNTTESRLPAVRRREHGDIRDYLPNRHAAGQRLGTPSDDTQMAFWTLEQLLADDGLQPDRLAQRFCREKIYGIGSAVKGFVRAYKEDKVSWEAAGQPSAGNGALMRIAPVLLPHLRQPSPALWADAALAGMVTHNDRASNAACVAFTDLLWQLLTLDSPPEPGWWLETLVAVAASLEGEDKVYHPSRPGLEYAGPLWRFTQEQVTSALEEDLPVLEACNRWYSGAYLMETLPSALYILCLHGHDPEQAILRAVNDTWDNDTVGAIVGAAVGALHGKSALPERWLSGLLGRTGESDDGRVFELIAQANDRFYR